MKKNSKGTNKIVFFAIVLIVIVNLLKTCDFEEHISFFNDDTLHILSSYDNQDLEDEITKYANKNKIDIDFTYMGDLDIIDELNNNSSEYDAVWISNSMWLYMLDNTSLTSDSKSLSISPVVLGIKKSKAEELNLIDKDVTNNDILNLIQNKKIKYVMSSVTSTNTGATAYFGFLNALAGNPEVLTEEDLDNEELINKLKSFFSGVERVSGDEDFLKEMFLRNDEYEAVIADEASLININENLKSQNKEQLYLIYPSDGVALNDSTFAFIKNNTDKEENFLKIQEYLLSDDGQEILTNAGRRTWYGGVTNNANTKVFNPNWGIDTTKYLAVTKFPSKKVITKALNLYIEALRKPTHTVFCLDYSGSMYGDGNNQLEDAMRYILNYEEASKDSLQFSKNDKITVITFSNGVNSIFETDNGQDTEKLILQIENEPVTGGTALYDAIIKGLDILSEESEDYNKTIIAMTDGAVNIGTYNDLSSKYESIKEEIPVYGITFGNAREYELEEIANLTNAKVFDGKEDLLQAFKEVRSYN